MKILPVISLICLVLTACLQEKSGDTSADQEKREPGIRVVEEFHSNGRLKSSTEALGELRQGVSREYRSDGTLENEIHYVQNRKHGLARNYYTDGKTVKNEIPYVDGYRHGLAKWNYASGRLYRETPYVNNTINGIRHTYYESGRLQAELPYNSSQPGIGLKEYTQDGKLKEFDEVIVIREENRISLDNSFTLVLTISDATRNVEFYQGDLTARAFWNDQLSPVITEKGTGKINIFVSRGTFKMETLNIVARIKTSLGHTLILQKEYHLAVENKF